MPNILINPNSGLIEFSTGIAGSSSFNSNFNSGNFATRLNYDNLGGLNLTSYVTGSASGQDRFSVDGVNGRLFSVTDNLSGSIFSVNDIAGLPIIEAFDDNTVVMGAFNRNDFIITGNSVGIGGLPNTGTTKLYVSGNLTVSGRIINNIVADQFSAWTGVRRYPPLDFLSATTNTTASGTVNYFPFLIKKDVVDPVACIEMTNYSTFDPKIDIGIYSGDYGFQNAKLIASGSITGSILNTGIYRTKLNGTFNKGPYIVASMLSTGEGSTFRILASHGFREHFGINTGSSTLHGLNSTALTHILAETGRSILPQNIGLGEWYVSSSTVLSPLVFLEY